MATWCVIIKTGHPHHTPITGSELNASAKENEARKDEQTLFLANMMFSGSTEINN